MTRLERASLIVSIAALAVSVATPVVTYYWLDATLQAFRNRARLEVADMRFVKTFDRAGRAAGPVQITMSLRNVGRLPTKEVYLTIRRQKSDVARRKSPTIRMDPPVGDKPELIDGGAAVYMKITQPLGPGETWEINMDERPDAVWAVTESGDRTSIFNAGSQRYLSGSFD